MKEIAKKKFSIKDLLHTYVRTIFRHEFDNTGLTKAKIMFTGFVAHIQPVKVHKRTLLFSTTLGMGIITFYLFLILIVTGILVMFHYVPSVAIGPDGLPEAYQRMLNLRSNIFFGNFLRNMHRWAAHAMVATVWLHMIRVFVTGAYKKPREFNWLIGSILGLLTLFLSYTGYLLPWDQLSYWGVKVGTEIARIAPGGDIIRGFLLGDVEVGGEALLRFYVLHCAVLPAVATFLIMVHFFRVRKDGGLAKPKYILDQLIPPEELGEVKNASVYREARSYKLVEVVKGVEPKVDDQIEHYVFSWPKLIVREAILFFIVLLVMTIVSLYINAPLEGPANPNLPTNPSKAPWYFLGLQELVSYHAIIGGVVIPGIMVMLIMFVPYIEIFVESVFGIKSRGDSGVWFAKERWLENLIFLSVMIWMIYLIIIGTYFRGPNWDFVTPWNMPHVGH